MKDATDLLSEYTKKATVTVTVKNIANTAAPSPPVVPVSTTSPLVATIAPPARHCTITLSAKARAAKDLE